jgi:rare lipoprotein A
VSRRAKLSAVTALIASAAVPSLGSAATGGAGLGNNTAPAGTSVLPGDISVTATSGGMTIATHASALLRKVLTFTGAVPASNAGKVVEIQRLGHQTDWAWGSTATAMVARDGTFTAVWRTNHIGRFSIRAIVNGNASTAAAAPTVTVTVYRPSLATLYGPGFWGQRTACGTVLKRSTIGVANRTLKCGEKVAIYYHGRTAIVPVIDRGPYANGADWDLTMATGRALGINGTAKIGAVSLPIQPALH